MISWHRSIGKSSEVARSGYVLVVALSLIGFLLLLTLSMTLLLRVETQSAKIRDNQTKAKQNALLGLQQALGALQLVMGPDQRVSATAEVLPGADPSRKHLTGVWVSDPAGASLNGTTYAEGELLRWLVSDFQGVNDHQSAAPTVGAVTLVGAGSLADADNNGVADDLDKIVRVRLSQVSDGQPSGNFAWWIGDEGVKASINLTDVSQHSAFGLNETKQAALQAFSSSARGQVAALAGLATVDLQSGGLADKLLDLDEMALIPSAPSPDQVKAYFHDLTTYSKGVLSDVRNGGLKQDLSLAFELSDAVFNASVFGSGGPDTIESPGFGRVQPIFRLANSSGTPANGPTWHLLRDYYSLYQRMENPMTDPTLPVQAMVPNRVELNPAGALQGVANLAAMRYITFSTMRLDAPGDPLRSDGDALVIPVKANYLPYVQRHMVSVGLSSEYRTDAEIMDILEFTGPTAAQQLADWKADPDTPNSFVKLNQHTRASFVVHNPYNVSLRHTGMISGIDYIKFRIEVESLWDADPDPNVVEMIKVDAPGAWNQHLLKVESGTIDPGAVKVYAASPGNPTVIKSASIHHGFSAPGVSPDFWITPPDKNNTTFEDSSFPVDRDSQVDIIAYCDSPNLTYRPRHSISVPGRDVPVAFNDANWHITQNMKFSNYSGFGFDILPSYVDWYGAPDSGQVFDADLYLSADIGTIVMPLMTFDFYLKPANESAFPYPGLSHTNPLAPIVDSMNLLPVELTHPSMDFGFSPYAPNWRIQVTRNLNTLTDPLESIGDAAFWGPGNTFSAGSTEVAAIALPTRPLVSLGGLQFANVGLYGHMPALAIGHSLASPYIRRDRVYEFFQNYTPSWNTSDYGKARIFYDLSYLCNQVLWDRYFFSSYARAYDAEADSYNGTPGDSFDRAFFSDGSAIQSLPNPRMELYRPTESVSEIKDKLFDTAGSPLDLAYERSAENLMVKGSFNLHSTSVQAWKAVLSSARAIAIYRSGETTATSSAPDRTPLARIQEPIMAAFDCESDDHLEAAGWGGFAVLSDAQLEALALAIVSEIKLRVAAQGALYTSMADFVNRSLTNDRFGLAGLLQAAIDKSGINTAFSHASIQVDAHDLRPSLGGFPFPENILDSDEAPRSAATSATGHIMQGDLLQAIGSFATLRSDSFRIRSYGEVLDPMTQEPTGRAWCEAIVQRIPDPVQPSNPDPQNAGYWQPLDEDFLGRKFKMIHFRWLDEDEV